MASRAPVARLQVLLVAVLLAASGRAGAASDAVPGPLVASASDLRFALEEIVAGFGRETGIEPRVSFGASGNLTRQIEQGAPFELFFSADEGCVARLAAQKLTRDEGTLYAVGRIVLFAPHGSPLVPDDRLQNLKALLSREGAWRFAIANPEHAPYGRAAQQALRASGMWDALRPHLVLGENISQAAQFASSGDTVGGIISHSLVLAPEVGAKGRFVLLPASLHAPLRQRMVLLRRAGAPAARLYEYMSTPPARAILTRYGFTLPTE